VTDGHAPVQCSHKSHPGPVLKAAKKGKPATQARKHEQMQARACLAIDCMLAASNAHIPQLHRMAWRCEQYSAGCKDKQHGRPSRNKGLSIGCHCHCCWQINWGRSMNCIALSSPRWFGGSSCPNSTNAERAKFSALCGASTWSTLPPSGASRWYREHQGGTLHLLLAK
jgi:hypothetical protein